MYVTWLLSIVGIVAAIVASVVLVFKGYPGWSMALFGVAILLTIVIAMLARASGQGGYERQGVASGRV